MPIVPQEQRLDSLRRKVLMSRNIRAGWLVDLAMGGLNPGFLRIRRLGVRIPSGAPTESACDLRKTF